MTSVSENEYYEIVNILPEVELGNRGLAQRAAAGSERLSRSPRQPQRSAQ